MRIPRAAVALCLTASLAGPVAAATLEPSPKSSAITSSAKTSATSSTLASTAVAKEPALTLTAMPGAGSTAAIVASALRQPVRALHGDLDAFRAWVDAEERALAAAVHVRHSAANGVHLLDLADADALRLDADAAWRDALASYETTAGDSGETLVFVRLHDRIALRLLMQLMRPKLTWAGAALVAESIDPVSARWLSKAFHAAVRGDAPALNLHTRLLRERLAFALGDQRGRIFSQVLAALDRLDGELADAGLPAGDALVEAMLPGLAAIAHGDPCAPGAGAPIAGGTSPGSVAPTPEDLDRLVRLDISMDDLRSEAQFDCGIATGGGAAGGMGGYGPAADAMACLGELLGATEEPADYGMCMAAGLGVTTPDEIGAGQMDRARGCSSPLADGGDEYEPFDLARWYHEEFVEEEMLRGESPVPQPPQDEDQKRREEINDHYDDSTVVKADVGLIEKVVGAIVEAVKAVVDWIVELFSGSDQSAPDAKAEAAGQDPKQEDTSDSGSDGENGSDRNGDEETRPETPDEGNGTTLPGPDDFGGGGCVDPLVELAEDCMERVLSQIPGYRGKDELRRQPGGINPIVAYIWEGSDHGVAGDLQGCGGTSASGSSVGCEQLTDPPSACPDPTVSAAARYFAEQARRDHLCALALCAPDLPCECTDALPDGAPPAPGNPGDPVGPSGPVDVFTLDSGVQLGGTGPTPILDVEAGSGAQPLGRGGLLLRP